MLKRQQELIRCGLVRCYNIKNVPVWVWVLAGIIVVALIALSVKLKMNKKYD